MKVLLTSALLLSASSAMATLGLEIVSITDTQIQYRVSGDLSDSATPNPTNGASFLYIRSPGNDWIDLPSSMISAGIDNQPIVGKTVSSQGIFFQDPSIVPADDHISLFFTSELTTSNVGSDLLITMNTHSGGTLNPNVPTLSLYWGNVLQDTVAVPEPSQYATAAAVLALGAVVYVRRRRQS